MASKRDTTSIRAVYGKTEDRYLELIRRFPLRPLRSDADLNAAVAVVDGLIDGDDLTNAERDYLDVLSDLVESYEDAAVPMRVVDDAEMLRFLIENRSITQSELARQSRIAESTLSEVQSGKRNLTRTQIGKLARFFQVEPGVFSFE